MQITSLKFQLCVHHKYVSLQRRTMDADPDPLNTRFTYDSNHITWIDLAWFPVVTPNHSVESISEVRDVRICEQNETWQLNSCLSPSPSPSQIQITAKFNHKFSVIITLLHTCFINWSVQVPQQYTTRDEDMRWLWYVVATKAFLSLLKLCLVSSVLCSELWFVQPKRTEPNNT